MPVDTTWIYDADGRLSDEVVTSPDATKVYADHYGYDLNNNRVLKTHDKGNNATIDETISDAFDADDRLSDETSSLKGLTHYGYDANGTQLEVSNDDAGQDDTYTYYLRNKLVGLDNSVSGSTVTYAYDEAGNRVRQVTDGTVKVYLTDGNSPSGYAQPIEVKATADGLPATTYVLSDRVTGQANGSSVLTYLLVDGHGSTQQVSSATGTIVQSLQYDAFGASINGTKPSATNTLFLFGGDAIYDPASGLYLHGNGTRGRSSFRFIQDDDRQYGSNGNPISLNLSLYANGNTINGIDPSGHMGIIGTLAAITVAVGLPVVLGIGIAGSLRHLPDGRTEFDTQLECCVWAS